MKATEKIPIQKLVSIEAAEPMNDENADTLKSFCTSCPIATSILKSPPRLGKHSLRKLLKSASGTAMLLAACSMLVIDTSFTMLLIRGTTRESNVSMPPITITSDNPASTQDGACFPRIEIFLKKPITGFAIRETTTAMRMYPSTLLRDQHRMPMMPRAAAIRMYFASLSVYLSLFSMVIDLLRFRLDG